MFDSNETIGTANPVIRMAETMAERVRMTGVYTLDDLARAGFRSAEIIEYLPEAQAHAKAAGWLPARDLATESA